MKAMSRPTAAPRRAQPRRRARGSHAAALALLGSATLVAPSAALAAVAPQPATLQARIDAVRSAWARRGAAASTPVPAQGWRLAQAANWTNWPKWSKWSNWTNK
jgi:hypothetical protein